MLKLAATKLPGLIHSKKRPYRSYQPAAPPSLPQNSQEDKKNQKRSRLAMLHTDAAQVGGRQVDVHPSPKRPNASFRFTASNHSDYSTS